VAEAYGAAVEGREPTLPEAPSYEAIATRMADSLTTSRLATLETYWRDRLAAVSPSLALPADRPRPASPRFSAASVPFALDAETSARVRAVAGACSTTPFVVLLAAYALYVRHLTGETAPVVFAPVENRPAGEAERAVGLFANILPHATDVSGDPSFRALLARTQGALLGDWEHQALPYDRILAQGPMAGLGAPRMQVMLNVMPRPEWPRLGSAAVRPMVVAPRAARVDWHLWLMDDAEAFTGAWEFSSERFDAATILRLADGVRTLVGRLVADMEAPVGESLGVLPALARPSGPEAVLAALAARRTAAVQPEEPPRTDTERRVAAMWAEALGLERVGRQADFFELGGHSLAAVRVLANVRQAFGREVPLGGLFANPTVAGLAALLDAEAPASIASPLVKLRDGWSGAPLVLAHALGGQAIAYAGLARALSGDRRVYGLEHPALHGGSAPSSLGELAAMYVAAIEAELPAGPLVLGGWSAGGALAHELACRLTARGRDVRLLAVFDGAPPPGPDALGPEDDEATALFHFAMDLAAREAKASPFTEAALAEMASGDRLDAVVAWARRENLIPDAFGDEDIRTTQQVFLATLRAYWPHRLGHFDGPMVLYRAADSDHATAADWAPFVTTLGVETVGGGHYGLNGLLGPTHAAGLAARLESAIAALESSR
jgi:thioesterase domain-containing protein